MKDYFLKISEFTDIGTYQEEKQTIIDENQINHAFDPANNIFDGLRETGDFIFDFVSNFSSQVFDYISNSF